MNRNVRAPPTQIIADASRGSPYWKNELEKDAKTNRRCTEIRAKYEALKAAGKDDCPTIASVVYKSVAALEASRDLSRTWVHVDMDCFFVRHNHTQMIFILRLCKRQR